MAAEIELFLPLTDRIRVFYSFLFKKKVHILIKFKLFVVGERYCNRGFLIFHLPLLKGLVRQWGGNKAKKMATIINFMLIIIFPPRLVFSLTTDRSLVTLHPSLCLTKLLPCLFESVYSPWQNFFLTRLLDGSLTIFLFSVSKGVLTFIVEPNGFS